MIQEDDRFLIKEKCEITSCERSIEEHINRGVIILDKWEGPTCRDVVDCIKRLLKTKPSGHAGTLDPHVTGVLPITLGKACKIIPALQGLDKEYVGIMHLHKDVDDKALREAAAKFIGIIKQTPPRKSAVARKPRKRRVYELEILDRKNRDVCMRIRCEAGTYIRVLFHDIGQMLNCGAHMKELRRIKAGHFTEDQAFKAQDVAAACEALKNSSETALRNIILPVEQAADHLRKIYIKDSAVRSVAHGSPLFTSGICKIQKNISKNELVAVFSLQNELIAIGYADMKSEDMAEKKARAVKIDSVLVDATKYEKDDKHIHKTLTKFDLIKKEIENILLNSPLSFELKHSELVLKWVLSLKPSADEALKIAALSHDIDRAITKMLEKDLKDYSKIDEFIKEHSIRSAKFICDILQKHNYSQPIIDKVKHLVENHEFGGDKESDVLMEADSLAYFDYNIPFYLKICGRERTKEKIKFMHRRLSAKAKKIVNQIKFNDQEIKQIVKEAISEYE